LLKENDIYLMDCIDGMKKLDAGCANLVISDPPYNVSGAKGIAGFKLKQYERVEETWDTFDDDDFLAFNEKWLSEMDRVLHEKGLAFIFCSFHNIFILQKILVNKMKYQLRNMIIWHKPNAFPSPYAWHGYFSFSNEYILFVAKPGCVKPHFNHSILKILNGGAFYRDCWIHNFVSGNKRENHPTQKPLEIIKAMIAIASYESDLIIDPFSGSGTVAVACAQYKRRFISFELEEKYWKISRKRLAAEGVSLTSGNDYPLGPTQSQLF